eukprot:4932689-Pyramimonas_sp.AAC.1
MGHLLRTRQGGGALDRAGAQHGAADRHRFALIPRLANGDFPLSRPHALIQTPLPLTPTRRQLL